MTSSLDHRPWPLPARRWNVFMRWHDLLFAHWPVAPAALRPLVPAGLELQTWEGRAWLGVVPFRMSGVRAQCLPALPGVSAFPELNVRTYVSAGGKPGVWFFSLDAASRLAVRVARRRFYLPYFDARMSAIAGPDGAVRYQSTRTHRGAPAARLAMRYWPTGEVYRSVPGSLDAWLTERYCLYAADAAGKIWRGEIHHAPWQLQPARAELVENTMAEQLGLELPAAPPLLHFSKLQEVVAWNVEKVDGRR